MSEIYFKRIQRKEGYESKSGQGYARNRTDHKLLVVEAGFWVHKGLFYYFPSFYMHFLNFFLVKALKISWVNFETIWSS